jgi:hypothetical protein
MGHVLQHDGPVWNVGRSAPSHSMQCGDGENAYGFSTPPLPSLVGLGSWSVSNQALAYVSGQSFTNATCILTCAINALRARLAQ